MKPPKQSPKYLTTVDINSSIYRKFNDIYEHPIKKANQIFIKVSVYFLKIFLYQISKKLTRLIRNTPVTFLKKKEFLIIWT